METFGFYILHAVVIGFLGGVLVASFLALPILAVFYLAGIFLALIAFLFLLTDRSPPIRITLIIVVGLFAAFLGIIRYSLFRRGEGNSYLEDRNGKQAVVKGIVSEEPSVTDDAQKSIVTITEADSISIHPAVKILVKSDFYPKLSYGDAVSIVGTIKKPETFDTDTGRTFNYPDFLAKDKIFYTMSLSQVTVVSHGGGSKIMQLLLSVKHFFVQHIESIIPKPESGLLAGYLVEGKQSLSQSIQDEFKVAGVIHTVALSGYNVTIIVQAVMAIFSFLPKVLQLSCGGIAVILFAFMTGGSASVVRASVMALVAIIGQGIGRTYNVARALTLTAFIMIIWNPMTLVFDPGFQLSFLATMGLVYLSPLLAPRLTWLPQKLKLRETMTSTLSAQLAVLPFLLYSSGQLSLVALPTNLLMLPWLPVTMLAGTITVTLSFISRILALPAGWITYWMLHFELGLVHMASHLPYAAVQVPFPLWLAVLIYVGVILGLLYNFSRSRTN